MLKDTEKLGNRGNLEIYTPERKAEFLLNAAITMKEYSEAVEKIREMGVDPKTIPHEKPFKNSPRIFTEKHR